MMKVFSGMVAAVALLAGSFLPGAAPALAHDAHSHGPAVTPPPGAQDGYRERTGRTPGL